MLYTLEKDFQYNLASGEIQILKSGAKIIRKENDKYIIKSGNKEYSIDVKIVENNPIYFKKTDLTTQLVNLLKTTKAKTAPKLASEIDLFIKDVIMKDKEINDLEDLKISANACILMYQQTNDDKYLKAFSNMGFDIDEKGNVFKK